MIEYLSTYLLGYDCIKSDESQKQHQRDNTNIPDGQAPLLRVRPSVVPPPKKEQKNKGQCCAKFFGWIFLATALIGLGVGLGSYFSGSNTYSDSVQSKVEATQSGRLIFSPFIFQTHSFIGISS